MNNHKGNNALKEGNEFLFEHNCLVAADVDKTLVTQEDKEDEMYKFKMLICPELMKLAEKGINLAFITGNSMNELASRLVKWILEEINVHSCYNVLSKLHFFSNSAGVYFYLNPDYILSNIDLKKESKAAILEKMEKEIFISDNGILMINPKFINTEYLERTRIRQHDVMNIREILEKIKTEYNGMFKNNRKRYETNYNIYGSDEPIPAGIAKEYCYIVKDGYDAAKLEERKVKYLEKGLERDCIVQFTIKPVLSFRYAKDRFVKKLFNNDLRTLIIDRVNEELKVKGLTNYLAKAGGRSSIDITPKRVNKKYALEFIIDHLNVQGSDEQPGSNTIYFGDEVIVGGGNDYEVTKIEGITVFAVNKDRQFVALRSSVILPSGVNDGPEATYIILSKLNQIVMEYNEHGSEHYPVELLKRQIYIDGIRKRIHEEAFVDQLSTQSLNVLYTITKLLAINDKHINSWINTNHKSIDDHLITTGLEDPGDE